MSSSPPRPSSPSEFIAIELESSLTEQLFGIKSFTMLTSTTRTAATADVTLLDDRTIHITLTSSGYMANGLVPQTFETIEALLASISDLYNAKRADLLWSKLKNI